MAAHALTTESVSYLFFIKSVIALGKLETPYMNQQSKTIRERLPKLPSVLRFYDICYIEAWKGENCHKNTNLDMCLPNAWCICISAI